jgi:hypothetical protein
MSNLPPGFTEPREHDDRCAALCEHVDLPASIACPVHGHDHDCTCDALAVMDAEREAEAYCDYLYDHEP